MALTQTQSETIPKPSIHNIQVATIPLIVSRKMSVVTAIFLTVQLLNHCRDTEKTVYLHCLSNRQ